MAIQVTGLFKSPTSNLIHESPLLKINAHLSYKGDLMVDLFVTSSDGICRDTVVYPNLNRETLTFNVNISDPYDQLINGLETFLITELQTSNSINSTSTFSRV